MIKYAPNKTHPKLSIPASSDTAGTSLDEVVQHLAHDPEFLSFCEIRGLYKTPQGGPGIRVLRVTESFLHSGDDRGKRGTTSDLSDADLAAALSQKADLLSLVPETLAFYDVDPETSPYDSQAFRKP